MLIVRFTASMISICLIFFPAGAAHAQAFPSKPIRILTQEPGGGNDFTARAIGQVISGTLGKPIIVDNRPVSIAIEIVAKAPPDGYTLLLTGATLWLAPYMQSYTPWDPVKDFSPITSTSVGPNVVVVHPALPVRSIKELIALAKAKPGELNYATGSLGSSTHISGELFKSMAGIDIVAIPFKGSGPSLVALLASEVQVMFPSTTSVAPHLKAGRVRGLAITSAPPSILFPELPTVASSGLPGYESVALIGIFAPAKTPAAVVNRLNQEIVRALAQNELKEKFLKVGVEPSTSTPEQLGAAVKADMMLLGKVIKDVGIRIE